MIDQEETKKRKENRLKYIITDTGLSIKTTDERVFVENNRITGFGFANKPKKFKHREKTTAMIDTRTNKMRKND